MSLAYSITEGFSFLAGLVFGSFLNVCIARLPLGESIVTPRSRCRACGQAIRWYDNLPLLSWIALRTRCRDCQTPISWQYPAVELATGVWFAIATATFAGMLANVQPAQAYSTEEWALSAILAVSEVVLGFFLIGLMVMDWQTGLLPNAFTFGGIAAALFIVCTEAIFLAPGEDQIVMNSTKQLRLRSPGSFAAQGNVFLTGPEHLIFGRVVAVCGVALLLISIRWIYKVLRKREGMGLGDVKMLATIAAFLGFWPAILAFFVGVLVACVYSLILLAARRATIASRLPFGSFLGIGGLIAAIFGDRIIAAYSLLLQ